MHCFPVRSFSSDQDGGRFIDIDPIAIVGAVAVPVPVPPIGSPLLVAVCCCGLVEMANQRSVGMIDRAKPIVSRYGRGFSWVGQSCV
jgi:hypothetical protein